jgi:ribosomal protein S18 acetylase RimI-like enzyme
MLNLPAANFHLRTIIDSDLPFLSALYASTRAAELAATDWSNEQKKFFLNSQFQLQHNYYLQQFSHEQFQVIERDGHALGRLYVGWEDNNLRLIDIALLPEYQHQGIGGALMRELMAQVSDKKGRLLLHVELTNPVRDWYLRLGFVPRSAGASSNPLYQQLQWPAE